MTKNEAINKLYELVSRAVANRNQKRHAYAGSSKAKSKP